ncbi:RNA polymerase subunit sigma [Arthrobacter sp. MYb211]|uniref:RNA polymerase sigma factor n=1 Tax=unclassified Arthrobacter TaxID=235627 RepID=UPI000CFC0F32|nr:MULTISPECIES: sigma-70 family RNA polymerase sigma factor [unclassified Arthrobacter]PRA03142.1 RNA polymerase subunit sigma [Arthrobacter sp. MYb229]PRA11967.1 RNA polymerase subunit sigma [Arthrobacter sp. MYb221]PRB49613.1 RNA polymerase subunit sigma [Arthrobacter sp. MYb216]PRC08322.1 RNA polymerase subunit sigma [Arthrobacter sp. MYb211]
MKQPFERIVQAHGLSVLRVCRALLDEHRAQDAWSETFLSALKAYPELDEEANVQAWLVRIAHRRAIDELRRHKPELSQAEVEPPKRVSTETSAEDHVANLELWQAVKLLPEKQRLVVAYRYLGGLSYAQIAEILSGSADAARRASADGIKNLRTHLSQDQLPGGDR